VPASLGEVEGATFLRHPVNQVIFDNTSAANPQSRTIVALCEKSPHACMRHVDKARHPHHKNICLDRSGIFLQTTRQK
jgi:hypothetical protein